MLRLGITRICQSRNLEITVHGVIIDVDRKSGKDVPIESLHLDVSLRVVCSCERVLNDQNQEKWTMNLDDNCFSLEAMSSVGKM